MRTVGALEDWNRGHYLKTFLRDSFVIFISCLELQHKHDLDSLDWLSLRFLSLPLVFSRLDAKQYLERRCFPLYWIEFCVAHVPQIRYLG
jgi:hypothetical protein